MPERSLKISPIIPLLDADEVHKIVGSFTEAERQVFELIRSTPAVRRSQILRQIGVSDRRLNTIVHSIWKKILRSCTADSGEAVAEFLAAKGAFELVAPQLRRTERQLINQGVEPSALRQFYRRAASILFNGLPVDVIESAELVDYARKHDRLKSPNEPREQDESIFAYSIISNAVSPYSTTGGTLEQKRTQTLRSLSVGYRHFRHSSDPQAELLFSFVYAYHLITAGNFDALARQIIERVRSLVTLLADELDPEVREYPDLLEALRYASVGEHEQALESCRRSCPDDHNFEGHSSALLLAKCDSLLALGQFELVASLAKQVERKLHGSRKDVGQIFRIRLLQLERAILCGTPLQIEKAAREFATAYARSPKPQFTHESHHRCMLPFIRLHLGTSFEQVAEECEIAIRWFTRHRINSDHPQSLALRGLHSYLTHAHDTAVLTRKRQLYSRKFTVVYGARAAILLSLLERSYQKIQS